MYRPRRGALDLDRYLLLLLGLLSSDEDSLEEDDDDERLRDLLLPRLSTLPGILSDHAKNF